MTTFPANVLAYSTYAKAPYPVAPGGAGYLSFKDALRSSHIASLPAASPVAKKDSVSGNVYVVNGVTRCGEATQFGEQRRHHH